MCRLAAYLGPERALADVIVAPKHSLLVQAQDAQEAKLAVNGDGFGIAWYGTRPDPGLYKDVLPAWSDRNLLNLCTHISAPLFLAHVRASTEGETSRTNCHPFTYENWSFMHNGQTGSFAKLRRPLEAVLSDDLYALRTGSTDSELIFLLMLQFGLQDSPDQACRAVIAQFHKAAEEQNVVPFFRMTCVLSDGQNLYGFRYASDGRYPTLYMSRSFLSGGLVLASEPLDANSANWQPVAPNQFVCFGADQAQSSTTLPLAPNDHAPVESTLIKLV